MGKKQPSDDYVRSLIKQLRDDPTLNLFAVWRWAGNTIPGRPHDVLTEIKRGRLHSAAALFNPRRLLNKLHWLADAGLQDREPWAWQVLGNDPALAARCVLVKGPASLTLVDQTSLERICMAEGLTLCDTAKERLSFYSEPKINCWEFLMHGGEVPKPEYDFPFRQLPRLFADLSPKCGLPGATIRIRGGVRVEIVTDYHRCFIEWKVPTRNGLRIWRAGRRPVSFERGHLGGSASSFLLAKNELLNHSDALQIAQSFVKGEGRPKRYLWRDITGIPDPTEYADL